MLEIVKGTLRGASSLAKAISVIDNDEPDSHVIIREIFNKTGNARTVGFTGSGGAGKTRLSENHTQISGQRIQSSVSLRWTQQAQLQEAQS